MLSSKVQACVLLNQLTLYDSGVSLEKLGLPALNLLEALIHCSCILAGPQRRMLRRKNIPKIK